MALTFFGDVAVGLVLVDPVAHSELSDVLLALQQLPLPSAVLNKRLSREQNQKRQPSLQSSSVISISPMALAYSLANL